ncbi:MAG: glycoside hydrolase family 125 protein [Chloroflexota bacterium]
MTAARKPRDIGNGLACASFGGAGEWLSLATVDPEVGFVELTGLPLFDPEWRGDEDAVRRYRSWMRREEHAFLHFEAGRAVVSTRQDAPRSTRGLVQRLVFRASRADRPAGIRIRFNGRLVRPTLAEITEVETPAGALLLGATLAERTAPAGTTPNAPGTTPAMAAAGKPAPGEPALAQVPAAGKPAPGEASGEASATTLDAREGTLRVSGEGPAVIVQAWLRQGDPGSTDRRSDARVAWKLMKRRMPTAIAWIDWPEDAEEVHVDVACTFDLPAATRPDWVGGAMSPEENGDFDDRPLQVPTRLVKALGRMNQRAASYVRTCTALQVDGSERVILADHRILPLSWTRDAYWQALLLLSSWSRGGHDDDARIVADHLRWLFLRCERPDGRWVRSHHADGRRKDLRFQADQQLYPLLELADFVAATGVLPDLPPEQSWAALVAEAWSAAEDAIDDAMGLIRTEENPADDVPVYPYLVSDQVLLWHVASRLAVLAPTLELAKGPFTTRASAVRDAVDEQFLVDGALGRQWAYSINGRGGKDRYMDANDLPVFLAPLWGFCKADDGGWQATMQFAFDGANPGFVPGPSGGLGSRHTPGTWTLGDIGRWVAFALMGDQDAADAALQRLVEIAFTDGMLPEAYDPEGSGSVVRHWFAWPGAALGALLLEHSSRSTGD